MPIFEGINIGILNPELNISVKDIDFYNRGIDFKILPDEYFEVSTIDNGATYQNRKVYTAVLKTKKKMNLKEDYKITITAFVSDFLEHRQSIFAYRSNGILG